MRNILLVLAFVVPACAAPVSPPKGLSDVDRAIIRGNNKHLLTWDQQQARKGKPVYKLDGVVIGEGPAGIAQLYQLIDLMPKGESIVIGPYLSGENGEKYPFDTAELYREANKRGISVLMPKAR